MSDTHQPSDPAPAQKPSGPSLAATVTAGVLLALYVGQTIAMMAYFAADDGKLWDHSLLIYNSFTAFAVAAGGVLLGTQIQQDNVAAARQQASDAKLEAGRVKQAVRDALSASHAAPAGEGMDQVRSLLSKAL